MARCGGIVRKIIPDFYMFQLCTFFINRFSFMAAELHQDAFSLINLVGYFNFFGLNGNIKGFSNFDDNTFRRCVRILRNTVNFQGVFREYCSR